MAFGLGFIAYGRKKTEAVRPGTGIGYQIALNAPVRHIGTETLAIGLINARSLRASNGLSKPTPFWRTAEKARSVNCTGPRGAAAPGRSPSSRAAILPAAASACRPALRA